MKQPPKLSAAPSMDGLMNIVYERSDVPLVHVIAKAPGGAAFTVGDHFETCPVCKAHGVTHAMFDAFMRKESAGSDLPRIPEVEIPFTTFDAPDRGGGVARPVGVRIEGDLLIQEFEIVDGPRKGEILTLRTRKR